MHLLNLTYNSVVIYMMNATLKRIQKELMLIKNMTTQSTVPVTIIWDVVYREHY